MSQDGQIITIGPLLALQPATMELEDMFWKDPSIFRRLQRSDIAIACIMLLEVAALAVLYPFATEGMLSRVMLVAVTLQSSAILLQKSHYQKLRTAIVFLVRILRTYCIYVGMFSLHRMSDGQVLHTRKHSWDKAPLLSINIGTHCLLSRVPFRNQVWQHGSALLVLVYAHISSTSVYWLAAGNLHEDGPPEILGFTYTAFSNVFGVIPTLLESTVGYDAGPAIEITDACPLRQACAINILLFLLLGGVLPLSWCYLWEFSAKRQFAAAAQLGSEAAVVQPAPPGVVKHPTTQAAVLLCAWTALCPLWHLSVTKLCSSFMPCDVRHELPAMH